MLKRCFCLFLCVCFLAGFAVPVYAEDGTEEETPYQSEYAYLNKDNVLGCDDIIEANPKRAPEDYRAWAQADSRWGSIGMGISGYTVAQIGCTISSVTKLIIQCGLRSSSSFNIATLANWLNSNSGYTSGGALYWGKPSACVSGFNNYGDLLNYGTYSSSGYNSQILSWIRSGYHMTINVNSGGHWIAVDEAKSLAAGQVYIMDSLSGLQNADLTLASRYSTFNMIHAYTGGTTPSGVDTTTPGKPALNNFKRSYVSGESVVFTWDSTTNTTHYNMYVDRPETDGTWTRIYNWKYTESGYTWTFEDGIYRVLLQSINSNVAGWPYTDADWVTFVVGPHEHDRGRYLYWEDTHPHRNCYECSVCGAIWADKGSSNTINTCLICNPHTHNKGKFVYFEKSHPHCNCYECSVCGAVWRDTSSSNYYESCLECHRPDKPVIAGLNESYEVQEPITIRWTYGANTTHCNYWLYAKDGDTWWIVNRIDYATSPVTETLNAGDYRVLVVATNSNYWEADNSTWLAKGSDYVYFTVGAAKEYTLSVKGVLDGTERDNVQGYGTFDMYINNNPDSMGCDTYSSQWKSGTSYNIMNIHPLEGYSYDGIQEGSRMGTISQDDATVVLRFSKNDFTTITETPKKETFNGHTYLYYSTPVTWYFAKDFCEAQGGHLVSVTTDDENEFVKGLIAGNSAWLGATDYGSEGTWKWVTGEAFGFSAWASGEPNNFSYSGSTNSSEDYAHYHLGNWNDTIGCTGGIGFVCEIDELEHVHSLQSVAAKEATCTAEGNVAYWYCDGCQKYFSDANAQKEISSASVVIPALGHDYSYSVTKAPTTSTIGTLAGTCSRCSGTTTVTLPKLNTTDYSYSVMAYASCTTTGTGRYVWKTTTYGTFFFDVTIGKTNHSYVETVTAPTCTTQGYSTYTCSRCGYSYVDSYAYALGHNFGEWTQTVAPTCTEKGEETRTCSRCSTTETREINALGHDFIHHAAQAPTCTAIGWDSYDTCSRCDYTTYIEKAALGHNYQSVVTTPTCTAGGYTTYTCSRCGDSYVADEAAALGHTLGAAVEENRVNPTCSTNGGFDTVTYCSVCGVELSRVHTDLAALGHVWNDGVINPAATCTSDGVKTFTCQRCGETKTEAIAATGHTPGESAKENEVAATCTTAGGYDMVIRCTVCNAILYTEHFEIAALGHDYQAVVTESTCTEGGYTTYTCSRCGDNYVADKTAALGHTPGEAAKENDTAPTCEAAGGFDMVVYCTVCGAEISREHTDVPALDHDWNKPEYIWADNYSTVTATRTCKNDASHKETETVNTTSEVKKPATYEAEGEIVYTATFENEAFATQTKAVATPKLEKPDDPTPSLPCDGGDDCPGNVFTDMPAKGNWAHDPIDWAIVTGVTSGTSETTFSPNAGCTRAQVVTFLWRAAGEPEPTTANNPFKDVAEGTWYYKAVLWASETGVTAGTSATTFSPNQTCTRGQIVTFLWRFEGSPAPKTTNNPFTDVKPGSYYEKAVLWASETGVTAGTSASTFSPNATCTRAQIVTFLYRDLGRSID